MRYGIRSDGKMESQQRFSKISCNHFTKCNEKYTCLHPKPSSARIHDAAAVEDQEILKGGGIGLLCISPVVIRRKCTYMVNYYRRFVSFLLFGMVCCSLAEHVNCRATKLFLNIRVSTWEKAKWQRAEKNAKANGDALLLPLWICHVAAVQEWQRKLEVSISYLEIKQIIIDVEYSTDERAERCKIKVDRRRTVTYKDVTKHHSSICKLRDHQISYIHYIC